MYPPLELLPWPLLADSFAINTWGLSALVPLNKLIFSTQEHFPFPSCATITCASHSKLVSSCPSSSSPSADGRTVIAIDTLGNGNRENREVGIENIWSLLPLVSTCFKAAIYSSKSWWWQPITLSSTGVTVLPVGVQKYGCIKKLISQTVEKVQISGSGRGKGE